MIEVSLTELIDSISVMQELGQKPMKPKVAFQVARLLREIEKEYSLFQNQRTELINKYGARDETGELKRDDKGNYSVDRENIEAFNTDLKELLNQTLTLNVEAIMLNDLGEINITPNEMLLLQPFMKE